MIFQKFGLQQDFMISYLEWRIWYMKAVKLILYKITWHSIRFVFQNQVYFRFEVVVGVSVSFFIFFFFDL